MYVLKDLNINYILYTTINNAKTWSLLSDNIVLYIENTKIYPESY